jgi:uncharacterized protein (DUF2062 family)
MPEEQKNIEQQTEKQHDKVEQHPQKKSGNFFSYFTKENAKKFIHDNVTHSTQSNAVIAISIGYGVFCGCIPLWGLQLIFAGITAHFMKLNPVIVMAFTLITLPPILPFVILASIVVGGWVSGKPTFIDLAQIDSKVMYSYLMQYLIGSIVLAIGAGLVFTAGSWLLLKIFRTNTQTS